MIKKVALIIWVSLLYFSTLSYSQISPGDLVEAHAHLEGMSNCTECHVLGDKVTNEKCLDCHVEIKNLISQNKGYHVSDEVKGKECASCHNDHHGRNFEIVRFKKDSFDHNLTGYELLGKHKEIKCEDCHKEDLIKDEKIKEKQGTYLGLGNECLDCHTDYHQGSLSNNCTDCHNHQAFKPILDFDHGKTKFALKGKHNEVDCIECHKKEVRNGQDFQAFTGLKFTKCTDCHKDIHENKFGQNCTECHSENSFREVKKMTNFDHDLTNYPLLGKHQKVDCKECHKTNYTKAIAYKQCTDCHKDDHKNELDINGKDPDCSECHSVNGFTPSSYSIEQHNQSEFALNGAHLATPCFSCHLKNESWHFRQIGLKCVDCHDNIHKDLIGDKFYPEQNCKTCHNENQWKNVQFDHNLTDFKLLGAHKNQDCRACHFTENENGTFSQNFSDFTNNCTDCHKDIHFKQFDKAGITDCTRCHNSESFKINNFDHEKTLFPLNGAHEKVSCKECHKEIKNEKGSFIHYKIKEFKCVDCHS